METLKERLKHCVINNKRLEAINTINRSFVINLKEAKQLVDKWWNDNSSTNFQEDIIKELKEKFKQRYSSYSYQCMDDNGVSTMENVPIRLKVGQTFKCAWGEYIVEDIKENDIWCDRISKETA
jgi:hypothetical protein